MVRAQIHRYISRPKYTRQSPDCPLVIFSFTALPSCLHCSTLYSSAFAQHCIVAHPPLSTSCTRVHPHRLYPPRVSPSDPVSLLQVRPLPAISSESQQKVHSRIITSTIIRIATGHCFDANYSQRFRPRSEDVLTCPHTHPHPHLHTRHHILFQCSEYAHERRRYIPRPRRLPAILQSEDTSESLGLFLKNSNCSLLRPIPPLTIPTNSQPLTITLNPDPP